MKPVINREELREVINKQVKNIAMTQSLIERLNDKCPPELIESHLNHIKKIEKLNNLLESSS